MQTATIPNSNLWGSEAALLEWRIILEAFKWNGIVEVDRQQLQQTQFSF